VILDSLGMTENHEKKAGPVVSVLIPTFNRPRYLSEALDSALNQSYRNLQVIVINDGGEDVGDIVDSFNDQRIVFINRKENRGKAFSLN
jgi:glycosyltransferase involved in cell wall biosynthesis